MPPQNRFRKLIGTRVFGFRSWVWLATLVAIVAAFFATCEVRSFLAVRNAERMIRESRPAMAAEEIRPFRGMLARSVKGCQTLFLTARSTREVSDLRFAAEACDLNGIRTPEFVAAVSRLAEIDGKDQVGYQILVDAITQGGANSILYLALLDLLERNKKNEEFTRVLGTALRALPNDLGLQVFAIRRFAGLGQWKDARTVAETIDLWGAAADDSLRLNIAHIFSRTGDAERAREIVNRTLAEVEKKGLNPSELSRYRAMGRQALEPPSQPSPVPAQSR